MGAKSLERLSVDVHDMFPLCWKHECVILLHSDSVCIFTCKFSRFDHFRFVEVPLSGSIHRTPSLALESIA